MDRRFYLIDIIFILIRLFAAGLAFLYAGSEKIDATQQMQLRYLAASFLLYSIFIIFAINFKNEKKDIIYRLTGFTDSSFLFVALLLYPELYHSIFFGLYLMASIHAIYFGLRQAFMLVAIISPVYIGLTDMRLIHDSILEFVIQLLSGISLPFVIAYLSDRNRDRMEIIKKLNDKLLAENEKKEKLLTELETKRSTLKSLYEFSNFISANIHTRELFNKIIDFISNHYQKKKFTILFKENGIGQKKDSNWHLFADGNIKYENNTDVACFGFSMVGQLAERGSSVLIDPIEKNEEVDRELCWFAYNGKFNKCNSDCKFKKLSDFDLYRSYKLIIPIIIRAKTLGAFMVLSDEDDEMTLADKNFFQAITNQMSIAIEKSMAYRELKKSSETDNLTGAYNREKMLSTAKEFIKECRKKRNGVAVLFLDIDHFKKINDRYGHQEGDQILKLLIRIVEKNIRDKDIVARYGGEEFVIIMPCFDNANAHIVGEKIRSKVMEAEYLTVDKQKIAMTISIGIALYPQHGKDIDTLLKKADKAMYAAKKKGRNRVVIYENF